MRTTCLVTGSTHALGLVLACALACGCTEPAPPRPTFVAMTFNTGTTPGLAHEDAPDDGYSSREADLADLHYGNGLAWLPAIESTRAFLAEVAPDVIGVQEIFHPADCANIPLDARAGFVCEAWVAGAPTVTQSVLGDAYQVMCHTGHADKCVAVRREFGSFRGCTADLCVEGAFGTSVAGCGGGARVARAVIELVDGGTLTLVNVHGTSGFSTEDQACRTRQVEQVFVDLGDGAPGADGAHTVVLGDLNTDPGRLADADASAQRWLDFAGPAGSSRFRFVSEIGETALPSYAGLLNIDHVVSNGPAGACWIAGTADHAPVTPMIYFDHKPVACAIERP